MRYEILIGLRYLKSKRKQLFISLITWISIGGVAVGVMTLIVVLAVMSAFEEDIKEKILGTNSHIIIQRLSGSYMNNYKEMVERIRSIDNINIKGVSPFIYNQVMLSTESNVAGIVIRGIDIKSAGDVTDIKRYIKYGSINNLIIEKPYDGIIIGKELFNTFGINIGDEITALSPLGRMTPMGMVPKVKKFTLVGVFDSGMFEFDSSMAFISLRSAQNLFNIGDSVNGIEVGLYNVYKAEEVGRHIQEKIGFEYGVRTWMQMNKNLFSALKMEKIVMFIILALIIVVAAFNIVSTLIMVVMEKGKDIAILRAMGAGRLNIMFIFAIEGIIIGLVGTIAGVISGYSLVPFINNIADLIEEMFDIDIFPSDIYYLDRLPAKIEIADVTLIALTALLVTFIAAIYPAWRASKVDPIETIRYE